MSLPQRSHLPRAQQGAILVISLILLLVMTVLGLAAMQVTRMEERMAGNLRDVNIAFQGAEAGLRDAENRLRLMVARPDTCAAAPCAIPSVWQRNVLPESLRNQDGTWWANNAQEYGADGVQEIQQTTADPRVLIEDAAFIPDSLTVGHAPPEGRNFYRITARSAGATDTAQAVLESTYTRRF
ncbi:MAG: PilX N-terminal domain-containing pilus assembly protein [Steroidobacteraceae bacterium]